MTQEERVYQILRSRAGDAVTVPELVAALGSAATRPRLLIAVVMYRVRARLPPMETIEYVRGGGYRLTIGKWEQV